MDILKIKESDTYDVCILIDNKHNDRDNITKWYCLKDDINYLSLGYVPQGKKATAKELKQFLVDIEPVLVKYGVKVLLVADSALVKMMGQVKRADVLYGNIIDYKDYKLVACPSYAALMYSDSAESSLFSSISCVPLALQGVSRQMLKDIIKKDSYPTDPVEIKGWLDSLLEYPLLAVDIETYGLKFYNCGLATISFCYYSGSGIAFCVSHKNQEVNVIKGLLREFFTNYKGTLVFHNGSFDITVLIYELFMSDLGDYKGLLKGLDTLCRDWIDTKILVYLATNNTGGNSLGLKDNVIDFAGDYAEDVKDINLLTTSKLLTYNLKDTICTRHLYFKFMPKVIEDNQEEVLKTIFMPALKNIIHMQLCGLPINMPKVLEVEAKLQDIADETLAIILNDPKVPLVVENKKRVMTVKKNESLKTKQVTTEYFDDKVSFNPNSNQDVSALLYDLYNLPIIDLTESKLPSTGAGTLSKLVDREDVSEEVKVLLKALIEYSKVNKLLTAFIPAFKQAQPVNGIHYLYGNFNLGGTVSGRLSSSNINLQNLPSSGSPYAKLIKQCFVAKAPEELFIGLDFASLEDRISALTTKDPAKLAIYLDQYDGHCYRAYAYYKEQMPDITDELNSATTEEEKVEIINSIAHRYKHLRQRSKAPTFACTYSGTAITLEKNLGFSKEEARNIESSFKELYKHSIDWVHGKLVEASKVGYVTLAFGLRLRTPLIKKCGVNGDIPKIAAAEARTVGNALGQSWGLLNTRAAIEVANELEKPENQWLRDNIRPVAHIHDAQYYIVTANDSVITRFNQILQKAVNWNKHPDIYHPEVGLGGNLSLFIDSWADELELPVQFNTEQLMELINKHMEN